MKLISMELRGSTNYFEFTKIDLILYDILYKAQKEILVLVDKLIHNIKLNNLIV